MSKEEFPPMIWMAVRFTKDGIAYLVAGKPRRTQEQIDDIYDICKTCDYFREASTRCNLCGCFLKKKIPWRTTRCPDNKW